jgi:hypothetical protein
MESNNDATISAISINLPLCWSQDIELWFVQIEAQFRTNNIKTENAKYDLVIPALPTDVIQKIRFFILNPPAENPYTNLKAALLREYAISDKDRYRQLIREVTLGDQKPSQLLSRMQCLWGSGSTENTFFKEMFLDRLPSDVQTVLAAVADSANLTKLAEMADNMLSIHANQQAICRISEGNHSNKNTSELKSELEQLRLELRDLKLQLNNQSTATRRLENRRSIPACFQVFNSPSSEDLCWYHVTFGRKAIKCIPPCKWSGNGSARE